MANNNNVGTSRRRRVVVRSRPPVPRQRGQFPRRRWARVGRFFGRLRRLKRPRLDVFADIVKSVTMSLNKPVMMLILALVVLFYLDHNDADGMIQQFCKDNKTPLCRFLLTNFSRIFALIVFVPTIYDCPQRMRAFALITVAALVVLLPILPFYVYAVYSLSLHTFLRVRSASTRYLVIAFVVAIYLIYHPRVLQSSRDWCVSSTYYTAAFDSNVYRFSINTTAYEYFDPYPFDNCCDPLALDRLSAAGVDHYEVVSRFINGRYYRCREKIYKL